MDGIHGDYMYCIQIAHHASQFPFHITCDIIRAIMGCDMIHIICTQD